MMDSVLVVGAGFAGSVCARELADAGYNVLIIDKRDHVGGNAHDKRDHSGNLIHPYGPHIFHTNSLKVLRYLSSFTQWRFYEHRVLAKVGNQLLPIPINRKTLNDLYKKEFSEQQAADFLEAMRIPRDPLVTSEDVVLNSVGKDLCEKFFSGYTRKQWGLELSELSAGVAARIPTRTNDDDRYFTDTYQLMPLDGYTAMFNKMLDHPNIKLSLNDSYQQYERETFGLKVFSGPIDEYFKFRYGRLPYRSLRFEHECIPEVARFQQVGTINFPNDYEYTRITEFSHLTGEVRGSASIVREYPCDIGDPYYPIPRPANNALFERYAQLADTEENVIFVGRLAQYKYYNMDQVVASALSKIGGWLAEKA